MSDTRVQAAALTTVASLAIAEMQFGIADAYSIRAQELHDFTLGEAMADAGGWGAARACAQAQLSKDCSTPDETPNYEEMEARSEAQVRISIGQARKQIEECADTYCIGSTCGQLTQLAVAEAITIADVRSFARSREQARVELKNAANRANRLSSVAVARGNYASAMSGISAMAQLYAQQGAQAGAAAAGTLSAGAMALGRIFGGPNQDGRQSSSGLADQTGTVTSKITQNNIDMGDQSGQTGVGVSNFWQNNFTAQQGQDRRAANGDLLQGNGNGEMLDTATMTRYENNATVWS